MPPSTEPSPYMATTICPQCSASVPVGEDATGTTVRCPECAYAFVAPPSASSYFIVPPSERAYSRLFILFAVLFSSGALFCAIVAVSIWLFTTSGPWNRGSVIAGVGRDFHLSVREAGDAMAKATTNDKEALAATKAIEQSATRVRGLPVRLKTVGISRPASKHNC